MRTDGKRETRKACKGKKVRWGGNMRENIFSKDDDDQFFEL